MSHTNFHPGVSSETDRGGATDTVVAKFSLISQNILAIVFGLLPIVFIPISYSPFELNKTMLVVLMVTVAILFYSFTVLRSGAINFRIPLTIASLWLVAVVSVISGLFSGDISDSILGSTLEVQSALFICLLALIASIAGLLKDAKSAILRFYFLLIVSAAVLFVFHALRVMFGESFLSFGIFTNNTATLLGDWNDLAVFFGLIATIVLIAVEQLDVNKTSRIILMSVLTGSLLILALVNYSAIWVILGVVSFIQLLYSLTKNRFGKDQLPGVADEGAKTTSIITAAIVFILSLSFVIAGSGLGSFVSNVTGVSYVEVRPSLEATLDMTRAAYADNGLLGIGTNRFADAWRLYKDPQINQTIFWNTSFGAGSGFIPTTLATSGVLMAIAWILFFLSLAYMAFRMVFTVRAADRMWYFLGTTSLVATGYLWIVTLIYNPASVMMLLTAFCTGIFVVSYMQIVPGRIYSLNVGSNRALGVAMIGVVTVVIVGSVAGIYGLSQQYVAIWGANKQLATMKAGDDIDVLESAMLKSYQTAPNDIYARELSYYQLLQMNSLLQVAEPTEDDVTRFQDAASAGIQAAQAAISLDPTEPANYIQLGHIYSALSAAGTEGSYDRAIETFDMAAKYDPKNPSIPFIKAQASALVGNVDKAREYANQAVALKINYTDALIFLAQLDIAAGNTKDAIEKVKAIVTFEPNNPARYYQLGVLLISDENTEVAKAAFSRAIELDKNYANARYYLALIYLDEGDTEAALKQLRIVSDLNPEIEELKTFISDIESGKINGLPEQGGSEVSTPTANGGDDEVTVDNDPDTDLVTPVNAIPSEEGAE